jgi:hypothetical protein
MRILNRGALLRKILDMMGKTRLIGWWTDAPTFGNRDAIKVI